ncbi:hypothetical protein K491DRAFT_689380 [Lophiostoma macrostomum CBS 122681]|uniref:Zn(2)-C6 fungal-type domain-containing protein n=1 Tax=Lophiostoma macrostomum CBS 122681 TaxID=1314788 RepID=A0A6A6TJ55_9PLEO|nr:hypothetical protein K491DRAFT_689380 [Lophiostoma macrostomum CBS 122681]
MSADKKSVLSLRKACSNCAKAKRRCTVQSPSCLRCRKKRLTCTYTLEPLPNDLEWKETFDPEAFEVKARCCFMELVASRDRSSFYTSVQIDAEWSGLHYVLAILRRAPELVVAGSSEPAAFVHPGLQFRGIHNYISRADEVLKSCNNQQIRELVQVHVDEIPLDDAITALQVLLLYLTRFLFGDDVQDQDYAAQYLTVLEDWSRRLWSSAWRRIPKGLSHWQAWLLGESTRRTIFVSWVIPCAYSGWKYGIGHPSIYMEALPFEKRIGLWQATSPQAWIASAGVQTGAEVGTQLISFHEFGVTMKHDPVVDPFLSMSLVAHNGKKKLCPLKNHLEAATAVNMKLGGLTCR